MKSYFMSFFFILICATIADAQSDFNAKKKTAIPNGGPGFVSKKVKGNSYQKSPLIETGNSLIDPLEKIQAEGLLGKSGQTIVHSPKTGLPIFISQAQADNSNLRVAISSGSPATNAANYLTQLSPTLGLTDAAAQFTVFKIEQDRLGGQVIRLQQIYNSIDIDGCESIIHINSSGSPTSWNGSYIKPDLIKKTTFAIAASSAINTAINDIKTQAHYIEMSDAEKEFLDYAAPDIKQVYYIDEQITRSCVPAYIIHVRPNFVDWWEYVIDAQTGNILSAHSKTCHVDGPQTSTGNDLNEQQKTINTYLKGATYYTIDASRPMYNAALSSMPDSPVGAIQTLDLNYTWGSNTAYKSIASTTNTFTPTAISAHNIAGKAFDYYQIIHNRNSIDGAGGTVISFINVANPDDGTPMDNAFRNGKAMYYGNGNLYFKPLAGGLDVGGHELTHGVIQSTANLNYQGESGAINESMADIFGCMIDSTNWTIGEDVVLLSAYPTGALRDLSDPHNGGTSLNTRGWQPKYLSEKYTGTADNGGVHINSGICNYAFYLFAQATKRTSAEQIFYRALTTYLVRSSQFIDLRIACISAATDLFGSSSNEVTQIGLAFDQVGITSTSGTPVSTAINDYPINPGPEYLLAYNMNTLLSKKLYEVMTSTGSSATINTTAAYSKASVTDDGSTAYYISSLNQIKSLYLTPGNTQEIIVEDEQIWNTVAVSKDGQRVAATTLAQDTAIYVYDFNTETWATFILYSPTFSEGIKSGGPIYADAIEWDHTGQFLVYDCYNEFKNTDGTNIDFWDINFIQVWDNTTNDFSDGTITKLFTSLPDSVSVGNPTFAKNSANIIAFDYIDDSSGDLYVVGCNTETNDVEPITTSNVLGYPNYNIADNQLGYVYNMSTHYPLSKSNNSIWRVDLNTDKITPSTDGNDNYYLGSSQWPVYFATGTRSLPTSIQIKNNSANKTSCYVYPNPTADNINVQLSSTEQTNADIKITNAIGQVVYTGTVKITMGDNSIPLAMPSNSSSGYYIVTIESANNQWLSRFVMM